MKTALLLAAALAIAAPAALAAPPSPPAGPAPTPAPTPALLARGRAAYEQHCARCHGPKGEADGPAAAALKDKPFNLAKQRLQAAFVFGAITEGIPGTPMPSFARLPAEERWAIAHHVEGLGPPR